MPKYEITYFYGSSYRTTIEAESEDEACEQIWELSDEELNAEALEMYGHGISECKQVD